MKAIERDTAIGGIRAVVAATVATLALLVLPAAAAAATINVTTTTDEFGTGSRCSLREAVSAANSDSLAQSPGCTAGSGSDVIALQSGTFTLSRKAPPPPPNTPDTTAEDANLYGDLDVTGPLSIVHSGIRPATIRGSVGGERVLHTLAPGVSLRGLTISGGSAGLSPEDRGGGILNEGVLSVTNSAIVGNGATFGGGLSTEGASTTGLTNVTISRNFANADGGGISVEAGGTVALKNVTVAGNGADGDRSGGGDGGGIFASTSGPPAVITLRDTIVADNNDNGDEAPDCAKLGGTFTSLGRNLIGNTNGCDYGRRGGDIVNRRALLIKLRDNGGPTLTYALRKTSPAIDNGQGCTRTDQRGIKRRLGGRCDIGAWELAKCEGAVINRIGTNGSDLLVGTSDVDGILALGGRDTLRGEGKRDGLCGGGGKDRLEGGGGPDNLDGGGGRDTCIGGGGRDSGRRCELPGAGG